MLTRILTSISLCATTLPFGLAAQDTKPQAEPKPTAIAAPLSAALPALNEQSSWEQNTAYEGEKPDKSKRGVYPVGNGRVFTYIGLGARANTMLAISGPTYAAASTNRPRGDFGELTLTLNADLKVQKIRRATTGNFVITSDATPAGLDLRTLTFAAPDATTITRVIVVHNGTGKPIADLELRANLTGGTVKVEGNRLLKASGTTKHAAFEMSGATASDNSLTQKIGNLDADAAHTTVLTITTGAKAIPSGTPALASAIAAAKASARWWNAKTAKMPRLRTDHRRIRDLFNDWKVLMLTMRDAKSGVVSPMVTRRGAWIRESNGPLLTFLRYSMWDEAKALLEYFFNAVRLTGEVREHYPLDLDFSSLSGKKTDWKKIKFPESDLLSWLVIQHHWYYRATWDAKLIEDHRPFLMECLTQQKRTNGMLRFSGHENYMRPTLHHLDINKMNKAPKLIAHAPESDRRAFALSSSVLFLVSMHAMGDMDNGIERMNNPKKWAMDPSDVPDKPSQKWLERSLPVMNDLEKNYWMAPATFPICLDVDEELKAHGNDWQGFFAPAISPITGDRHDEPFANINLLPLWIGFTFPTGERSQHNLRATLGRLWHRTKDGKRVGALVGTTPTVGHFTGDVPGMLLTALIERDSRDRVQAHMDMLKIAEPAGEWGQFYNPEGRPIATDDPDWPHRLSPNECGINVNASVFALNGIRHVNVANFDNRAIKVKLRLPPGARFLEMDHLKKDNREFNVHVDEFFAPLNAEERKQNDAQQDKRYKRDPKASHRRFRFRMELLSDNPVMGRYQVDADVSGTMFVRYLFRGIVGGEKGVIDEREFWKEDANQFYMDGANQETPARRDIKLTKGAQILALTNRQQCTTILGKTGVTYLDTGLPLGGPELPRAMMKGGKPTHPTLYLDVGFDAADARAFQPSWLWSSRRWKKLLADYEAAGGKIIRPRYVTAYAQKNGSAWQPHNADDGVFATNTAGPVTIRFTVRAAQARDDLVLRIGANCSYSIKLAGDEIAAESGEGQLIRDQDATLIEVKKGDNIFEVQLRGQGAKQFTAQLTDASGLPVPGIR